MRSLKYFSQESLNIRFWSFSQHLSVPGSSFISRANCFFFSPRLSRYSRISFPCPLYKKLFIILILLIDQLCFQELSKCYQSETTDIHWCIPHIAVRSRTKDVYILGNLYQNTPFWFFSALGRLVWNHKRICERIALSIQRAA